MDNAPTPVEPTPTITDTAKYLYTSSNPDAAFKPKKPKPFYARTLGARKGRMEKIEDLLHPLIKAGLVEVIRRKFAPPLIKWKAQPKPETA